jgi:hypothetical protein
MSKKFNTDVVYKVTQEAKGKGLEMGHLYFKNVPVTFAQVLKAGKKYQSEDRAYQLNLFINQDTMSKVEEIGLNKEMAQVGVTKIKKGANRGKLKYELDEHNKDYENMFGAQFSRNTVKRDKDGAIVKQYEPLKVVDTEGNAFTQEVGNGSICHVKLFAYRNEENMLVVMLDTVVVVEHVAYNRDGDYFDEELGITVKSEKKVESSVTPVEVPDSDVSDDLPFDDIPF